MQSRLQAYYVRAFPAMQDVQIGELTSISAGWESEMYSLDVEYGPAGARRRAAQILRIYPGDDAHDKSAHEFHGMKRLYQAGYPVPQVLALERENSPFGQPFVIMEKIDGQVLWPLLFNSSGKKQQELLTLFCNLFVQLHTLDWRPFVDDAASYEAKGPYAFVDEWLDLGRGVGTRFPVPGLLPIIEWLEERRDDVPCPQPSLVHLDFHPGNVLLRDDGAAFVVDWTQLRVSDPRFDLAWTLLLVGTHEDARWRDVILHEYERLAGITVEQLAYFDVFACIKRLVSVAISLSDRPERFGMRPAAVAMMKQQMGAIRRVYDLLLERTGLRVPEIEAMLASVHGQA
jgi:aminoglycoside phosphotransferase (APT) family kinase protein